MAKAMSSSMLLFVSLLCVSPAFPHCEIPCGIYGDEMRFEMLAEHLTTIEKSMKLVVELSKVGGKNYNQIVRWVNNKEKHAKAIQEIIHQYFMTQRVKPVDEKNTKAYKKYVEQITLLHQMLVHAMKAKQTVDLGHVEKLRALSASFRTAYFGPKPK